MPFGLRDLVELPLLVPYNSFPVAPAIGFNVIGSPLLHGSQKKKLLRQVVFHLVAALSVSMLTWKLLHWCSGPNGSLSPA